MRRSVYEFIEQPSYDIIYVIQSLSDELEKSWLIYSLKEGQK